MQKQKSAPKVEPLLGRKLAVGDRAPDFELPDQDGMTHKLSDYLGHWVLLYFYPKDDTPGCTKEACGIRDTFSRFEKMDTLVLGVSIDPSKSHRKFKEKYSLPFILLSDEKKIVVKKYGVWGKKKFMGREYLGTFRASFLINPRGEIIKIYTDVKPAEHAENVLTDLIR
ncbi:MAG: thioredoxin-dependent thiol peroxidase [Patescibacteria group bacterium]